VSDGFVASRDDGGVPILALSRRKRATNSLRITDYAGKLDDNARRFRVGEYLQTAAAESGILLAEWSGQGAYRELTQ